SHTILNTVRKSLECNPINSFIQSPFASPCLVEVTKVRFRNHAILDTAEVELHQARTSGLMTKLRIAYMASIKLDATNLHLGHHCRRPKRKCHGRTVAVCVLA